MKRMIGLLSCFVLLLVTGGAAMAADQTVNLTVGAVDHVAITGAIVDLSITTATNGVLDGDTDSSSSLAWGTNQADRVISVVSSMNSAFTLTVAASEVGAGEGTAAGAVAVSTTPVNLITAISQCSGTSPLLYSASADFSDGTAVEAHTVTYTITGG